MKNNILKRVVTGFLVGIITVSSVMANAGITAYAVDTDVSDGTVSGTGSVEAARGNWVTNLESPTVYRIYPVIVPDPDVITEGYTLKYNDYYYFKDVAVYEISGDNTESALNAYAFKSSTTITGKTIKDSKLVLGVNQGNTFEELGLNLSLPTQGFSATNPNYIEFSDQLSDAITTDENGNVQEILSNYITYLESKKNNLSAKQKSELELLEEITAYGTSNYSKGAKRIGLCVEVCSVGINRAGGYYIFSWGDLQKTGVKDDAYYIYHPLDMANENNKLLTWSAKYTTDEGEFTVKPELNGNAVFLSYSVNGNTDGYSQGINATLSYTGDIKANVDEKADTALGISTTAYTTKTKTLANLGSSEYKSALLDIFSNPDINITKPKLYCIGDTFDDSLLGTRGSNIDTNYLALPDSSVTDYGLVGYGNLEKSYIDKIKDNNLYLAGYTTVALDVKDNALALSYIYDETKNLQNLFKDVDVKSVASSITDKNDNAFGSSYNMKFSFGNSSLINTAIKAITDDAITSEFTGVSLTTSKSANYSNGKLVSQADSTESLNLLAKLQGATLLAGKISGEPQDDGIVKGADGTMYVTFSNFVKRTYVKSKMTQISLQQQIKENGNQSIEIANVEATKTAQYLVQDKKTWETSGEGDAFAVVYRTGDYDLKDATNLISEMSDKLPTTISKENGASNLASAFHEATGAEVQGYKYLGKGDTSVSVGSVVKDSEGNLDGLSVLVIYVNAMNISSSKSADSLDSDELNYIYPSLLGQRSNSSGITALGTGVSNMVLPYTVSQSISGDLYNFSGTDGLFYYPTTGLFGVAKQNTKSFSQASYPSYAYNISRALWGDNLVMSNYKGLVATSSDLRNYIRNDLGLLIGAKGQYSGVSAGINVDATISETKHDNYNFIADILRRWFTTETGTRTNEDGEEETYSYQQEHTENVTQSSNYAVTHHLDKYDPLVLPTAGNDNSGSAALSIQTNISIQNKLALVGMSDKKLSVYGEVPFKLYYPYFSSTGVLSTVSPMTVYAMSEKVRSMTPTVLNGYKLEYAGLGGVAAHGEVTSETVATGTNAKALSEKFGGLQVMYQGGNVNFRCYDDIAITLSSYALDITHATINGIDVRNEFSSSNAAYKSDEEHQAYVSAFKENLQTDITMKSFNGNSVVKTYNMTQAVANKTTVIKDTESSTFSLEFKNGKLTDDTKDAVISDMATTYGITRAEASQMFTDAGFEKQIKDMFEDSLDTNNKSDGKWYTEDSITLVINKYATVVKGGDFTCSFKIDYGAGPSQDAYDIRKNGTEGYRADFFISLLLPKNFTIGETTYDLQGKTIIIKEQKVKDASFVIGNITTADMRK